MYQCRSKKERAERLRYRQQYLFNFNHGRQKPRERLTLEDYERLYNDIRYAWADQTGMDLKPMKRGKYIADLPLVTVMTWMNQAQSIKHMGILLFIDSKPLFDTGLEWITCFSRTYFEDLWTPELIKNRVNRYSEVYGVPGVMASLTIWDISGPGFFPLRPHENLLRFLVVQDADGKLLWLEVCPFEGSFTTTYMNSAFRAMLQGIELPWLRCGKCQKFVQPKILASRLVTAGKDDFDQFLLSGNHQGPQAMLLNSQLEKARQSVEVTTRRFLKQKRNSWVKYLQAALRDQLDGISEEIMTNLERGIPHNGKLTESQNLEWEKILKTVNEMLRFSALLFNRVSKYEVKPVPVKGEGLPEMLVEEKENLGAIISSPYEHLIECADFAEKKETFYILGEEEASMDQEPDEFDLESEESEEEEEVYTLKEGQEVRKT